MVDLRNIRELTDKGEAEYQKVWDEVPNKDPPLWMLYEEEYSTPVVFDDGLPRKIDVDATIKTGMDLALLVDGALGVSVEEARSHPQMWSWLSLLFYKQLRKGEMGDWPTSKSGQSGASMEKFVFDEAYGAFKYYRHRVYSRYWLWKTYGEDARVYLVTSANKWSEISEQTLGVMEIISCPGLIGAVNLLYLDESSKTGFKLGAGGDGPGSPRRFRDVFWQFVETYHMQGMDKEQIVNLLPSEFDKYRGIA